MLLQKCLNWSMWPCRVVLAFNSRRSRPAHLTPIRPPASRLLCGLEMQQRRPRAVRCPWINGAMPWRQSLGSGSAASGSIPFAEDPILGAMGSPRPTSPDMLAGANASGIQSQPTGGATSTVKSLRSWFCPLPNSNRLQAPEISVWPEVAAPTIPPPRQQQATIATTWTPTTQQQQLQQQLARIILPQISPKIP